MLEKYPNRLKLYNEIPYVKEFLANNTTAERLQQLYTNILEEYKSTEYYHAHHAFVWEVARFVFRKDGYEWYDRVHKEYQTCDRHFFSLFSAVLEIEYGIPSYRV